MNPLKRYLLSLYFRARLWCQGVRFFEGDLPSDAEMLYDRRVQITDGLEMDIHIFGTYCLDIILKRKRLGAEIFRSYIVEATSDTEKHPCLKKFVRKLYYFNGRLNHFPDNDPDALILVTQVYCDYVKAVLAIED